MGIDFIQQICIVYIIDFKSWAFLLEHKHIFELFKIEKPLNPGLMLLFVSYPFGWKVVLDHIFEGTIVPQESQLYNMVTELLPLHSLIAIDINFLEKVNQCQSYLMLKLFIFLFIIQMLKHAGYKVIHGQTLFPLLKPLLNQGHFLSMQHLKDLVLSYLLTIVLLCLFWLLLFFRTLICWFSLV